MLIIDCTLAGAIRELLTHPKMGDELAGHLAKLAEPDTAKRLAMLLLDKAL
jgi:hypothetical protein